MVFSPITLWQINGEKWKQWHTLFSWTPKSLGMLTAAMKSKDAEMEAPILWPPDAKS